MSHLIGLNEYLDAHYRESVFDQTVLENQQWQIHAQPHRIFQARILETITYKGLRRLALGKSPFNNLIQCRILCPQGKARVQ